MPLIFGHFGGSSSGIDMSSDLTEAPKGDDSKLDAESVAGLSSTVDAEDPLEDPDPDPAPTPAPETPSTRDISSGQKKKVTWPDQKDGGVIDPVFMAKVINDTPSKILPKPTVIIDHEIKEPVCVWCRRQWADSDSGVRRSLSVVILIAFAFAGSGIFYAIEKEALGYQYWNALSYVNSIYTTIGKYYCME